jgi:predicted MPP superfamily phosphohydrolase
MRFIFIIILAIIILSEIYVFKGIRSIVTPDNQKIFYIIYYLTVLLTLTGVFSLIIFSSKNPGETNLAINILFGLAFSFILIKLIISGLLVIEDLYRFFRYIIENLTVKGHAGLVSRNRAVGFSIITIASAFFILCLYGLFYGKYDYKVRNITLSFNDLPQEFDGFRILQISDIHSGTFDNIKAVKRGVELIKKQNADLLLFTGDLVNNLADEIKPYIEIFGSITAPFGKFSILGNHDYGQYYKWRSKEAWQNNLDKLCDYHRLMGFRLLNNEYIELRKDSTMIQLAGVENWGKPPFYRYGDLDKALQNSKDGIFTILMSHDPSHWEGQVLGFEKHIHLTLSGHTHGMQMGIKTNGFRWSPVKLMYRNWGGLYNENGKILYVNTGFGFIGFPGRIGIWPEITVIELKKK